MKVCSNRLKAASVAMVMTFGGNVMAQDSGRQSPIAVEKQGSLAVGGSVKRLD
jgi:hypothetical protein